MAYIIDNEFLDRTPFLSRLGYLYVVTQAAKPKYYFAWTLGKSGSITYFCSLSHKSGRRFESLVEGK